MISANQEPAGKTYDIVVIGASAGGVAALKELLAALDPSLPAALFVVLHQSANSPGLLPTVLARSSTLPIVAPTDGAVIRPGQVYVALPNAHLFLQKDRVRVLRGPPENSHRPSIDTLFRSAAVAHGARVIGVVLSGLLDDGTAGLEAIKSCGGLAVVQSPAEAQHSDMPANALAGVDVDHCLPIDGIARLLGRLAGTPVPASEPGSERVAERLKVETDFALLARDINDMEQLGPLSGFVCPACNGALWSLEGDGSLRFRCHVGHAYSAETLLMEQGLEIERALYTALRLLEERARAARQLARRAPGGWIGSTDPSALEHKALQLDETAGVLRRLIIQGARLLEQRGSAVGDAPSEARKRQSG